MNQPKSGKLAETQSVVNFHKLEGSMNLFNEDDEDEDEEEATQYDEDGYDEKTGTWADSDFGQDGVLTDPDGAN